MEAPGFLVVLYMMFNLPTPLPRENWVMAGMFVGGPRGLASATTSLE